MLKTLEKKLRSIPSKNTLKPLAAWVTALRHRLRSDIFFSTRVKIIGFITLLTISMAVGYALLLSYAQHVILIGMVDAVTIAITTGKIEQNVFLSANATVVHAALFVMCIIILLSILSGLLVSRLALAPVSRALQLQKKFILSVAHELRTPLAILKTNNEVNLLEDDLTENTRTLLLENIGDINHINEILNNLLLFNRTGNPEAIFYDEVDITGLFFKMRKDFRTLASSRGVVFTTKAENVPHVRGNLVALEQVFYNLIKNAILYTPQGGTVTMDCTRVTEHEVTIAITDNGIGIPKVDLPHIFEPFFRTDSGGKLARGTGLGLTLVLEIIKLHHGRIELESVVSKGTTFLVSIPRQETAYAMPPLHTPKTAISFDFT